MDPHWNRRQFVRSVVGGAAAGGLGRLPASVAAEREYPFSTLQEAERAPGSIRASETFRVVWAADVHYGFGSGDKILPPLLREMHALEPRPAFFGIAGDLIQKASLHFGQVPDEKQKQEAVAEFRAFKEHLSQSIRASPCIWPWAITTPIPARASRRCSIKSFRIGRNITRSRSRESPSSSSTAAVVVCCRRRRRAWFREQVRKHHRPGSTLVVVLHQPSLGFVVRERGVTAAVREALADCRGDLWMIAGHEHHNKDDCFRLPHAVITQAAITAGNPSAFGTERPGYWIYGFTKGKVTARIFRRLGHGYAVAPPPPKDQGAAHSFAVRGSAGHPVEGAGGRRRRTVSRRDPGRLVLELLALQQAPGLSVSPEARWREGEALCSC